MRGKGRIYQKKLAHKRRRRALWLIFFALSAGTLIFFCLAFVSQLRALSIQHVNVTGVSSLSTTAIQNLIVDAVSGNYLGFFSKANVLIYPKQKIIDTLYASPSVKHVSVSKDSFNVISIAVTGRSEASQWCEGGIGSSSPCFSMDEAGFIFAPALAPSQGFIYRGLVTLDPVGKTLLPEADFKKIEFFVQELRGLSLAPREAVFESVDYATIVLAGGGKLVINMSDDLSAVLSNISAIITDRTVTPSLSHFLSTLDYLKLDTGEKVIYKVRK